jgi:septal ring factor EnvC (AmiA/AmiB activator)
MKLRPVTFTYKADSTGIQQYGLIAEEVEKVYPELVIDDSDGRAETVAYQVLPAMLLNEVQKQTRAEQRLARQLAQKDAQIAALQKQLDTIRKKDDQIDAMAERINALEQQARRATGEHLASAMR